MEDFARYRAAVDCYWDPVDRFFDELPGELYAQGVLLRQDLAMRWSSTGDFHDILRSPDAHPLLHCHLWLLDDLCAAGNERTSIERHLFAAMVFSLGLASIQHQIQAIDSFIDERWAGLGDALSRRIVVEFTEVVPGVRSFWVSYHDVWNSAADAVAAGADEPRTAARLAPFMLSGVAVFAATGRADRSSSLVATLEHLNAVLAMRHDLLAIRRDLSQETITEPVRRMIDAVGVDDARDPDTVFGALLLAGAVDVAAASWDRDLVAFSEGARALELPTLERYGDHLAQLMEDLRSAMRIGGRSVAPKAARPAFEAASDPAAIAVDMAQRFLVTDPTFRDAWEVHRWGMAGRPEVIARFPAGLVIEVLGRCGSDVADLADDYCRLSAKQSFAYYDRLPYQETDTIGAMLRLYPFTRQTASHRAVLDDLVARLADHVGPDGRLPVWLVDEEASYGLMGEGCGTIEANLLRGLMAYDASGLANLIDPAFDRLAADFAERGAAITVNYTRPYLLAAMAALLQQRPHSAAMAALSDTIELEAQRARMTPQTAACLLLASGDGGDPRWDSVVLKGQSFDGSWDAEPFFFAPNRGGSATWFRSKLLTSAVCYDALATRRRVEEAPTALADERR